MIRNKYGNHDLEWKDELYIKYVLNGIINDMLVNENINNDNIKLTVGEEYIYANKSILTAVVPYFSFINSGNFLENQKNEIEFQDINIDTLKSIVNFINTGNILITESNYIDLMEAVDIFGLTSYFKIPFFNFFLRNSCAVRIRTLEYFKKYRYKELFDAFLKIIVQRIRRNTSITSRNLVKENTSLDTFESILLTDDLSVLDICTLLNTWIECHEPLCPLYQTEFQPFVYIKYLDELEKASQHVDFIKKYKNYIKKRIYLGRPKYIEDGLQNEVLRERIETALLLNIEENYGKIGEKILLFYGGFVDDVSSNHAQLSSMECLRHGGSSMKDGLWSSELPETLLNVYGLVPADDRVIQNSKWSRANHAYCTADYLLYTLGGGPQGYEAKCEVYNVEENEWKEIAALPGKATHEACAVVFDGKVHFIGGSNSSGEVTNEVWKYNETENVWKKCPPLQAKRKSHGACSILGAMYVFGGISENNESLRSVEKYDEMLEKWIEVSHMPDCRSHFGYVGYKNYIYVLGGHFIFHATGSTSSQTFCNKSVIRYDIYTDKWTIFSDLLAVRSHVVCCLHDNRIYLAGNDKYHPFLSDVFIFNPETGRCSHSTSPIRRPRNGASLQWVTMPPY